MAEFLRLKLMPLENKLKAAQSSEYDNQTIPIQYSTVRYTGDFSWWDLFLSFFFKIPPNPGDRSWSHLPTNPPSPSQGSPSLRTAVEPHSVPSCS